MAKIDLQSIVHDAGMSARPEYYSGRGATASDLNDRILEQIHSGIARNAGAAPAAQFVQMVDDLPKLSATDFLLALFQLERNDWVWQHERAPKTNGIYATDDGSAFGTLMSVFGGMNNRDETASIKSNFIRRHEDELRQDQKDRPAERQWDRFVRHFG